jgi:hypothetical protein
MNRPSDHEKPATSAHTRGDDSDLGGTTGPGPKPGYAVSDPAPFDTDAGSNETGGTTGTGPKPGYAVTARDGETGGGTGGGPKPGLAVEDKG